MSDRQPTTPEFASPGSESGHARPDGDVAAAADRSRSRQVRSAGQTVAYSALGAMLAVSAIAGAVMLSGRPGEVAPTADGGMPDSQAYDGGSSTPPELPTVDGSTGVAEESVPIETEPQPAVDSGDLGLSVPISSPTCDGTWVVLLGAATDAARYAPDVQAILDRNPGADYTLTRGGCSSMRQQLPDGSLIYAVYTGPYPDQAAACSARASFGDGTYVKRMDNSTPAEQLWEC